MNLQFNRLLSVCALCMMLGLMSAYGQIVSGTVVDENGVPLPGASVVVQDTNVGVSTDFDGQFSIQANEGDTLVVSFIGYATQSVLLGADTSISIQLQPDSALEEVVVTALGIERSTKALGYSVTQVEGDEVNIVKQTNAINALQGKIAGVQITGNATGAKGSSRVIIRGNSSLNGYNQPLYVIDGITISNANLGSAGLWGGSDAGDGVSALNPDEVESISVLKGGAAAALYGSRASNGVIIITTKSGIGAEGINVELSSSVQFDDLRNDPLDTQKEYGQGIDFDAEGDPESNYSSWGVRLGSIATSAQWDGVDRPYVDRGDNQLKFYKTGQTFINTIAVSSANESGNYRVSFSNLQNSDIIPNSTLDRNSLGINLNQNIGGFSASVSLKYVVDDSVGQPRLSDSPGNANVGVRLFAANVDVNDMLGEGGKGTNADGTEFRTSDNTFSQNPWFAAYQYFNDSIKERFIGSAEIRWDIADYLYAKGRYGIDRFDYDRTSGTPYGTAYQPLGSMNEYNRTDKQYDADFFVGTDGLSILDDFSLTGFVGLGTNNSQFESKSLNGGNFIIPFLYSVKNTQNQSTGYGYSEKQINSAYGSVELAYSDAVYLTLTARNDWFSTLSIAGKESPNNDLYTSASLSLVVSDLIELPEAVTFLKLRGGYSQVAGGADSPYALSLNYGIVGQGHQGASLGRVLNGSIPNPEITPFEKNETEFGLDLRVLDNRIGLDFTYYDNETNGDIVGVSASPTSGYTSALANLGIITNKGYEILLNASPLEINDFSWDLTLNYSHNDSKIVSTNEDETNISLDEPRSRNLRVTHIVGETYGALFGTSYERDEQGRIVHEIDADDGTPLPKQGPRKILGFGVSPNSIGITNSFRYKNLSLSFLIEGKSGGQIFSGTNSGLKSSGLHKDTIDEDGRENGLVVSGVNEEGVAFTSTIAPERIEDYWGRRASIAEENIYDSDYLRLRQLSLGYTFPQDLLQNTFIKSARVSLIGRNLLLLSNSVPNVDPESGYNVSNSQGLEWYGLPIPRSIGVNVNLNF